jgi:hypothetical protein
MGIGISTFLIAAGAVLRFAMRDETWHAINLHGAGVVLLIVGAIGLVVTLVLWAPRQRTTVVARETLDDTAHVHYR